MTPEYIEWLRAMVHEVCQEAARRSARDLFRAIARELRQQEAGT